MSPRRSRLALSAAVAACLHLEALGEGYRAAGNHAPASALLDQRPLSPSARLGRVVPPELDRVVLELLAKDPEGRPRTAAEVTARLGQLRFTDPWSPVRAERWWRTHLPAEAASAAGTAAPPERVPPVPDRVSLPPASLQERTIPDGPLPKSLPLLHSILAP